MSLRILIVDDDERERIVLRYILEQVEDVKIIAEASNGMEGVLLAKEKKPDLVFLDIYMPELSGMDTARRLREFAEPPLFAFVTLRPEHAVEAFELGALDYIVKPLEPGRIKETIERAKKRLTHEKYLNSRVEEMLRGRIDTLLKSLPKDDIIYGKLPIKERGKTTLINQDDIIYCESQGKKVFLYTDNEDYGTSYTLSELEERLDGTKFFRVHQAFIVNLNRVREIVAFGEGSYLINLDKTKKQIILSRSRAKVLRHKLGI
ncbi:MAG: LytR/AlgR family response regulator transcription factor [Acidobacteriota bacterium]